MNSHFSPEHDPERTCWCRPTGVHYDQNGARYMIEDMQTIQSSGTLDPNGQFSTIMESSVIDEIIKHPCRRCGHSPDVHAFDDDRLSEFENVPWEARPFRCLGPRRDGCAVSCPDFTGEAITLQEPT